MAFLCPILFPVTNPKAICITEAAQLYVGRLLNAGTITRDLLEQIGRDVARDYLLFNDVDIAHLNEVLEKKKKADVVEDQSHADNISKP